MHVMFDNRLALEKDAFIFNETFNFSKDSEHYNVLMTFLANTVMQAV